MTELHALTFTTPVGPFSIATDAADSAIVATAFGPVDALRSRLSTQRLSLAGASPLLASARHQVESYFAGRLRAFDLPLAPVGTPFQQRVWAALRAVPFGETRSYGDLARLLVSSARAVGRANATNPICLLVPCHRVIGADGTLTGFAFGTDIKRRLLAHEGATLPDLFSPRPTT